MRGAQGTRNHSAKKSHCASVVITVTARLLAPNAKSTNQSRKPSPRRPRGEGPVRVNSALEGDEPLGLLAEALDRQPHRVARAQEARRLEPSADPRGCAGRDHVARVQRHEMADIADDVVDPEDQIGGVAVLPPLAIDLGPQLELAGV